MELEQNVWLLDGNVNEPFDILKADAREIVGNERNVNIRQFPLFSLGVRAKKENLAKLNALLADIGSKLADMLDYRLFSNHSLTFSISSKSAFVYGSLAILNMFSL